MGSLFLEIGQCGCQIGAELNPRLSSSYYCTRNRPPNRLHAIMIDTQPKVLQPFLDKQPKWLDPLNVKYFQHGRGNNWSYGYLHERPSQKYHQQLLPKHHQFSHLEPNSATLQMYINQNKTICQYAMERIRRELQTVDCAMCINVIGSLGGGTGSGLGTRIIQRIGDELTIDVYSHLILPNKSGETPLQVYNCALSLAIIQQHSSAIFTYQNDKMITLFQGKERNIESKYGEGSLDEINAHLSSSIAQFIRINDVEGYDKFYTDITGSCVLSQEMKYLNLVGVQSKKGWETLFEGLFEEVKNNQNDCYGEQFGKKDKREKLLQGSLLLIGKQMCQYDQKYSKKLKNITNPIFEDSLEVQFIKSKGTRPNIQQNQKNKQEGQCQAIYVSNHSSITNYLKYLVESGTQKYRAGAYLWHYQYADLQTAFDSLTNTLDQYTYFTHSK